MNQKEFNALLEQVLDLGVEITMMRKDGLTKYDMNTGMKSHLHIWLDGDVCRYEARYDVSGVLEDMQDLTAAVRKCLCGRDFMNLAWCGNI